MHLPFSQIHDPPSLSHTHTHRKSVLKKNVLGTDTSQDAHAHPDSPKRGGKDADEGGKDKEKEKVKMNCFESLYF